jgi:hypothetical protein
VLRLFLKQTLGREMSALEETYCAVSRNGAIVSTKKLLTEDGLAVGNRDRIEKPTEQTVRILEKLIDMKYHFVLQSSEGQSLKVVDDSGMSKCVLFVRSKSIQLFCLKLPREPARALLAELHLVANVRVSKKSRFAYVDFDQTRDWRTIVMFVAELPRSSQCQCGHPRDTVAARLESKAKSAA